MRTLLLELRPATIVEESMDELLRQLADAAKAHTQTPISLSLTGGCSFPPDVQLALFRIAQEGLNNAIRHAHASQITLGLYCRSGRATLGISDNGRGFDRDKVALGHFGLSIMRERAEAIGAEFTLETEPEGGTEITVIWIDPEGDSDGRIR
jgi:two-component system nitrate/nitrite sensor histidine kinase NarX